MTEDQVIKAALDKLVSQRDASAKLVSGRWINEDEDPLLRREIMGGHGSIGDVYEDEHADLIVILHRTIGAQIHVLQAGRALFYGNFDHYAPKELQQVALVLARAILAK